MAEQRIKHLEMIQSVVSRLASNSFALKGWSITVVSALLALAAKDANERYALLALFPVACFWGLDAYYLWQERLFRALYAAVRDDIENPDDDQRVPVFSLNPSPFVDQVAPWQAVLVSPTIAFLHGPMLAGVLVVVLYSRYQ